MRKDRIIYEGIKALRTGIGAVISTFPVLMLFLFISPVTKVEAQVYPVSVITQLTPPYTVNLEDYLAPGCEQLKVIIVQRDLTQAPYKLYLRMEIELNGKTIIRTSPNYIPQPFTLEPGIPTLLSGSSLAPFFDPANMEFTGYSRDQYIRTKILPEGAYIITFTAYDWTRRDVSLSHGGSFFCYLARSGPPMLNLPFNNALVTSSSPQYVNFQWLPGTASSPNSAFSTRYRFELFEMRVGGISPSEIVTSTRPFFVSETDRNNLVYSIPEPLLEKGMRYVWRVRAYDVRGKDYIRNNGMSEVFSFVYGEGEGGILDFGEIGNFVAGALSPRKAKLSWDASDDYASYKIYYRKKGKENKWYESETVQSSAELNGLTPGTVYECRVQGKKMNAWGSFSSTDTVLMPAIPVIECGSPFTPLDVANHEPLPELMKLQTFDAGGFMVTVIDPYAMTTVPGRFTGKGFVQVPLFGHKKIRCEFKDIFINTDFQMTEGSIRLIYDHSGNNAIWDIDEVFEGGTENGSVISGKEEVDLVIPDIVITASESIMLDTARDEILVVVEAQDTFRIDVAEALRENAGSSLTVQDSEGNLYSVDTKTGKTVSLGKVPPQGSPQQLATPLPGVIDNRKGKVIFEAIPNQTKFAFDKRDVKYARSNIFMEEYETMETEDGELYDIPFKLIPAGETDVVLARAELKGKTVKADSIVFRSGTGTIYKAEKTGNDEFLLTLPSGKANDGIDVYATYTDSKGKTYVLGKLKVISYPVRQPRLTLVPVNGNGTNIDPAVVKEELDRIYHKVGVDWEVNLDENFETTIDSLDIQDSGLFSMYTEGMKKLNNEFVMSKQQSFDASAVYLFLLQHSDDGVATGDMPRGKQFGYIFTETARTAGNEAIYRTIAHEIAHGAFSLSHTFDEKYQIPEKTTTNLLDYTAGTDLVKHQWDAIHDPGLVIGMFERDEEGMMSYCFAPKPSKQGSYEGQREVVKAQITSGTGLSTMTQECTEIFYFHIEDQPYNSCCDEYGKEVLVKPEYKSDWYTEKDYCLKVLKPILESFGVLKGQVRGLESNQDTRKIAACYNLEQFFTGRQVDEAFSRLFETPFFSQICNDATKRLSGSGSIETVNLEFNVALALTPIGEIRAIFSYLRAKNFLQGTKLFATKKGSSIEILSKEGGEKVAAFSDNLLTEINFIDEGGEVIGTLGKVKIIDKDGNELESIIEIIRKDGQIGLRKSIANIGIDLPKFTTLIDDKIKIIAKEALYGNQPESFLNSEFFTGELLEDILTYRRFGGNAKLGGSYVSTLKNLSREELALTKEFNNSMRFEAVIRVPKGEKINFGKVGPWPPKAPEYMGGADQIILKFGYPENAWVQSIKDLSTGRIYTYGEFRLTFPNLCQ